MECAIGDIHISCNVYIQLLWLSTLGSKHSHYRMCIVCFEFNLMWHIKLVTFVCVSFFLPTLLLPNVTVVYAIVI